MALTQQEFAKLKMQLEAKKGTSEASFFEPKKSLVESITNSRPAKSIKNTLGEAALGNISPLETGVRVAGDVLSAPFEAVGAIAAPVVGAALDTELAQSIIQSEPGKKAMALLQKGGAEYQAAKQQNPRIFELLEGTGQIAGAATGLKGAAKVGSVGLDIAKKTASSVGSTLEPVTAMGSKVLDTMGDVGRTIQRLPERASVNIAAQDARRDAVKQLGSKTLTEAVDDGVNYLDLKIAKTLSTGEKKATKKLLDTAIKFANKDTDVDPRELVGNVAIKRLQEADKIRNSVGKKLGEVAKNLGAVTKEELRPSVLVRLQSVPGLENVSLTPRGSLNFAETALGTGLTKTEVSTINKIFKEAVTDDTGYKKHVLRQAIFEDLGGKSKAGIKTTASADKAIEAIREGLADVLEGKNKDYKVLSKEYRNVLTPMKDLRNLIDPKGELPEDFLNMKAGILARRLTSNAASGQNLSAYLRALDDVLKKNGVKAPVRTEKLQEMLNIISKYIDVDAKTSLSGIIDKSIEKAGPTTAFEMVSTAAKTAVGKTPEVRRAAFEKAFAEILK